jgi:hypothetical protein
MKKTNVNTGPSSQLSVVSLQLRREWGPDGNPIASGQLSIIGLDLKLKTDNCKLKTGFWLP